MAKLVVFDFDGTITRKDTMLALARYGCGTAGYLVRMGILFPWLVLHVLGLYSNQKTKERFLKLFFGGMPLEDFGSLCFSFNKDELNKLIYPAALASIEEYRKAGDRVLIITASAENWVKPWCDACQVECIGSKLETKDGKLTGRLLGKNCYGEEKVRRLLEVADPKMYDEFIVYGDSRGDYALGQIATRFYYRQFS